MEVYRQELSPTHFLERAGEAYADQFAVVDGKLMVTWRELRARARRFAAGLRQAGLRKGDRIAFLALNSEPLLLAHFAVPLAGGILVPINTRLSPADIAYITRQAGATMLFYSPELESLLTEIPASIRQVDTRAGLEQILAHGSEDDIASWLEDEYETITINYSSGTTGLPKGVMYHHRGAYLNSLAMALDHRLTVDSVYLWTLPMFHCNGWMFPWALAAVGARSICLARFDAGEVWRQFGEGVTHFCAAPTVLTMLINAPGVRRLDQPIRVFTAGAPPSPTLIARLSELNFDLEHVYGLTETYGPFTINVASRESQSLPADQRARQKSRQGFPNVCAGQVRVVDEAMCDVTADGKSMGEVVMRGNVVMQGYFQDAEATGQAFRGGWFHSGDVGVRHPDGSIELRDRKKDIIISGGENISTIEVEQAVCSHTAVMECAVIAIPDDQWGEVPKAFVTLKPDARASEAEIIEHCRGCLAGFKVPKAVVFGTLPKTSTGKIQKYVLREQEWSGRERRIN